MKLTKEEYQYSKAIYEQIYVKNNVSQGYASFFQAKDDSFFRNQLSDVRFYLYRPSAKVKSYIINQLEQEILLYQVKILQAILQSVHLKTSLSTLKLALLNEKGKCFSFLIDFFGTYFLSTFDESNLPYIPYALKCKKFDLKMESLHEYFSQLKRLELTVKRYEEMPNEICHRVMVSFDKNGTRENFYEAIERVIDQLSMQKSLGSFLSSPNGQHIFLPFYASFNTIFHEMGHFFFTEIEHIKKQFFYQKFRVLEGIFHFQDSLAIELLTEYISIHSAELVSSGSWPYLKFEQNRYSSLLSLIEPFWEQFHSLIMYYMQENRPFLLEKLLGPSFLEYKKYISFFSLTNPYVTVFDKRTIMYYIKQMKEYFLKYQINYKEVFDREVERLENDGKRVRILESGYQKLVEEEKFLSNISKSF